LGRDVGRVRHPPLECRTIDAQHLQRELFALRVLMHHLDEFCSRLRGAEKRLGAQHPDDMRLTERWKRKASER